MAARRQVFLFRKGIFAFLLGGLWTGVLYFSAEDAPSLPDVIDEQLAAVVQIQLIKRKEEAFGVKDLEDFFLPENRQTQNGQPIDEREIGSGFIISPDGYIVTARHLLDGVDEVHVILNDGSRLQSEIVGSDPQSNVAILKVGGEDLPAIPFEDSIKRRAGQLVFAIGSPMAISFRNTVTMGVVAAIHTRADEEDSDAFWLTDAAMNMGNSGGPLFNSDGQLLGMSSVSGSGGNSFSGLSIVIPAERVARSASKIIMAGRGGKARLGIQYGPVSRSRRQEGAAQIVEVEPGSSAYEAGLRRGDIILAVNGATLESHLDLPKEIENKIPGDVITLTIQRGTDAINMQIRLKPQEQKEKKVPGSEPPLDATMREFGFMIDDLSLPLIYDLGVPVEEGVVVLYVDPSSKAYRESDIRGGMIIVEIAGEKVRDRADFIRIFQAKAQGSTHLVRVYRPHAQASILTALVRP